MSETRIPTAAAQASKPLVDLALRYLNLVPAAIVVCALYFGQPVLIPLAVAILFAFALAPLVGRLRSFGAGRIVWVLVSTLLAFGLIAGTGAFVTMKATALVDELPRHQGNLVDKVRSIRGTVDTNVVERASDLMRNLRAQIIGTPTTPPSSSGQKLDAPPSASAPVPVQIQAPESAPLEIAASFAETLLWLVATAGVIVIFVIFILFYKEDIRDRFIRLAGSTEMQKTTLLLDDGAERLGHYLLTQTAINACFGIAIGFALWLIGLPNPTVWGFSVAVLRFIPYVGIPLAAILPTLLALSVDPGWSMALWTIALFTVGEIFVGQAIEPWVFGRRMGMSPLAIVVAATFWTWLWGPVGLLLSTPLTMCLVVLGRHVEHLRFFDVLLGDQPPLAAEESLYIRMLGDDADQAAAEAESFLKENSLHRYYDDVALRALALGQSDVNRGALDRERAVKVRETTRALIENLSDAKSEIEEPESAQLAPADTTVLCIGGRGPLDEASALLLIDLVEKAGLKARLIAESEASAASVHQPEGSNTKVVCVCYLDAANFARARY